MTVTVRLAVSADRVAALTQRLLDQQDRASPEYRRWLTPVEFGESFGATDAQVAAVSAWLQGQALTVSRVSAARTTLTVTGTAGQVQAAFAVSLRQLRRGSESFYANATQPSVAAEAAGLIAGVSGLEDVPSGVGFGGDASADPLAAIVALLDENASPVLSFAGTACIGGMAQADVDSYESLLRQANAQGVTVLAADACAGSAQGFSGWFGRGDRGCGFGWCGFGCGGVGIFVGGSAGVAGGSWFAGGCVSVFSGSCCEQS